MKILEPQSAVLSNAEVLVHLTNISSKRKAQAPQGRTTRLKSPNFETVVRELTSFLTPEGRSPVPPYKDQYSPAKIRALMLKLEKFKFTKAELIMILNLRPQQPVLLDTIVEECDARLTPEQQEEVLEVIAEVLGCDEALEDE